MSTTTTRAFPSVPDRARHPGAGHLDARRPDAGRPDAGRPDAGHPHAGLTEAECSAAARAARWLPGAWWVQCDEDDRGHAGIGLVSDDAGPEDGVLAFLLWREDGALRLAFGQGELCADLGAHPDVDAAMDAVRRALGAAASAARWVGGAGGGRPAAAGPRALRDPDAAAGRLADWADDARRAGRTRRSDDLVRLAWQAYDRPKCAAG